MTHKIKIAGLTLAAIFLFIVVLFYIRTQSFNYKVNQSIDNCVATEGLSREQCAAIEIDEYISSCKFFQPTKTTEQCTNMYKEEYEK